MSEDLVFEARQDAGTVLGMPVLRRLSAVLQIFAVLSVAGCHELLVEPARGSSTALSLSLSPLDAQQEGAVAQGPGAAFDAADLVRIRLLRGAEVVADLERAFAPDGSETRIRVEVEVAEEQETLQLDLTLSVQADALFEAKRSVALRQGETTSAEVSLEPVPAGVKIQDGPVLLEAIGADAQLSGAVVFATDDPIPGLGLSWTSSAPPVVQVSADGRVTALAPGNAQITGSHEGFSGSVTVTVEVAVASIAVEPEDAALTSLGETLAFTATALDANGNPIPSEAGDFAWSSSDEDVATISDEGVATATGDGTTTIAATREGAAGSAELTVAASVPVEFPDPSLEAAVREAIGKPTGEILDTDLTDLLSLTATSSDISDLTGLEFATSLESLNLRDNSISDVTPLRGLTRLTSLTLTTNSISDVTPLAELAGLANLTLSDNAISDITPLAELTGLRVLGISLNPISDLAPLQGLTGLTTLSLVGSSISDITPIQGFTSLTTLFLLDNSISDLAPLEGLTGLRTLWLMENAITDLTPLQGLTGLRDLRLNENSISDLTPLRELTGLALLVLNGNEIADVGPLVDNEDLGSGDQVGLSNNPLGQQALCEQIPALQARGVSVSFSGACEPG